MVQPAMEQPNSSYDLKGGYKDSSYEPFLVVAESISKEQRPEFASQDIHIGHD